MDVFLQMVVSYPTVVYTVLLAVCLLYWLVAMLGLVDLELFDGWLETDASDAVEAVDGGGVAGILSKFGLAGLPLMIVLTVLVMTAWIASYFADYLVLRHLPGGLVRFVLGTGVVVGSFVAAVPVAGLLLRPVRLVYDKLRPEPPRSLLGMVGTVRSPRVDALQGIAAVEDGGAGLVLQVRNESAAGFARGDRVVLIEYLEAQNAYRVIGEDEFRGP
ncbi:hypothetical protein [Marilutibacter aestuarii]|uniref:DUF1449 family protein n=1 Tax=Marilutibacter aestuarii TaxID=1706195 RepID=A0A508A677_9GAMM|nr:hypothetical protein [Lysobacter aestuarii]TQD45479.1 hypothetical protein FKV25_08050 [Lysobacter aestuarii]